MPHLAPVHWRELARVFERVGWKRSRVKGDHLVYTKEGCMRPVVLPMDRRVEVFVIMNNLRTARMSRERYIELLEEL